MAGGSILEVDIADIARFFDTLDHAHLLEMLSWGAETHGDVLRDHL